MHSPDDIRLPSILVVAVATAVLISGGCRRENTGPDQASRTQSTSTRATGVNGPVTITGRVLDTQSGKGISDAYVIVLAPGVTFEEWEQSEGDAMMVLMAGAARSDSVGGYGIPELDRDQEYTVMITARGYRPAIFENGLAIHVDDKSPIRIAPVRLEPR